MWARAVGNIPTGSYLQQPKTQCSNSSTLGAVWQAAAAQDSDQSLLKPNECLLGWLTVISVFSVRLPGMDVLAYKPEISPPPDFGQTAGESQSWQGSWELFTSVLSTLY